VTIAIIALAGWVLWWGILYLLKEPEDDQQYDEDDYYEYEYK
jgi:hypothetical protein